MCATASSLSTLSRQSNASPAYSLPSASTTSSLACPHVFLLRWPRFSAKGEGANPSKWPLFGSPRNRSATPRRGSLPRAYNKSMTYVVQAEAPRPQPGLALVALAIVLCVGGCHSIPPLDTKPLDTAGMSYDTIQQVKAFNITAPEVAQLATARQSGFSDASCVAALGIYRGRSQPFDAGDGIASLIRAQVGED